MKKTIGSFALVCLLGTGLLLSGCGSSGSSSVDGKVVKGAVEGATVFTACIDADDQISLAVPAGSRLSNAVGVFRLPVPVCVDYSLVSQGGTDTVSELAVGQMVALKGDANVTPLTTLVALAPAADRAAIIALIKALGATDYNDDISTSTPAVMMLARTVDAVLSGIDTAIVDADNGVTAAQRAVVQAQLVKGIVQAVKGAAADDLATPSILVGLVSTGVKNALDVISAPGSNITIADTTTLANTVANGAVDAAAKSIGATVATAVAQGKTTKVAEALDADQKAALTAAVAALVEAIKDDAGVDISPTPDDYEPDVDMDPADDDDDTGADTGADQNTDVQ